MIGDQIVRLRRQRRADTHGDQRLAERAGVSMSEVVRALITKELEK